MNIQHTGALWYEKISTHYVTLSRVFTRLWTFQHNKAIYYEKMSICYYVKVLYKQISTRLSRQNAIRGYNTMSSYAKV